MPETSEQLNAQLPVTDLHHMSNHIQSTEAIYRVTVTKQLLVEINNLQVL